MSEAVTIHYQGEPTGGVDEQGNPVFGPSVPVAIQAIGVAPTQGSESASDSGPVSVNGYTLYLPFGTEVPATATFTIRGVEGWQVEADASQADWASIFSSWTPGTVASVKRAS